MSIPLIITYREMLKLKNEKATFSTIVKNSQIIECVLNITETRGSLRFTPNENIDVTVIDKNVPALNTILLHPSFENS